MSETLINPFTDQKIVGSVLSGNTLKNIEGLPETAVGVQLPDPVDPSQLKVFFIEWDFLHKHHEVEEYQKIKPLIQGLWQNGYPLIGHREVISLELLQKKLLTAPIPRSPKEKMDGLLIYLAKQQEEDGGNISYHDLKDFKKLYFKSNAESQFYLDTISKRGLIKIDGREGTGAISLSLTYQGLSYIIDLETEGPSSNNCFIAISFADEMASYRDSIIKVVESHGYQPIVVNSDFIVKNDTPVIDEILAGIRRSRFCISDFTMQRTGVYFEAGYALGLGRPVIYLNQRKDFENIHFDLRPFQHVLYSDHAELENALSIKIAAWIGSLNPDYKPQ